MPLEDTRFSPDAWLRTCQECGNVQTSSAPVYGIEPTGAWKNQKCKKCKSESLDYGTMNEYVEDTE